MTAALFGRRVVIVEKGVFVGGAVANTGTLPGKTLRETALAFSGLKSRGLHGVDLSLRREASVADFMYHERQVGAEERARTLDRFAAAGVTLLRGEAAFADPHTARVAVRGGERILRAGTILVATAPPSPEAARTIASRAARDPGQHVGCP